MSRYTFWCCMKKIKFFVVIFYRSFILYTSSEFLNIHIVSLVDYNIYERKKRLKLLKMSINYRIKNEQNFIKIWYLTQMWRGTM